MQVSFVLKVSLAVSTHTGKLATCSKAGSDELTSLPLMETGPRVPTNLLHVNRVCIQRAA